MKKMRIIICDANQAESAACAALCHEICGADIRTEIRHYRKSSELLFDMEDRAFSSAVDIMLVDPENGFDRAAADVRKCGYDGIIIFISHSSAPERYQQAFDSGAFNYLEKFGDYDVRFDRFCGVLRRALQAQRDLRRQFISLKYAGEYRHIDVKDIKYFESNMNHTVNVVYDGGNFRFTGSLQDIESRFSGYGFARAHRSFIVALGAIKILSAEGLVLKDGSRIPVSRSCYAALRAAFELYWKKVLSKNF